MATSASNLPDLSRRTFVCGTAGLFSLSFTDMRALAEPTPPLDSYSDRAVRLMNESNVIDMLTFFRASRLDPEGPNTIESAAERLTSWLKNPEMIGEEELRRYRESGINAIYIGNNNYRLLSPNDRRDGAEQFYSLWAKMFEVQSSSLLNVLKPDDLDRAKESSKLGIILGFQDGEHFETVDDVNYFYGLGQRISQLAYNEKNHLASGAFADDTGITQAGVRVVKRMNEVGMALDLSHASDQTIYDGIAISDVPVIISHSNARAITPGHPRCVTDMAIKALAAKGGALALAVQRQFVTDYEPATVEHFVDHVDHIANLVGIEHVGIGADNDLAPFDNIDPEVMVMAKQRDYPGYRYRHKLMLDGMDHPRRTYEVVESMIRRNYSDDDIKAVLGGNFKRVLTNIWSA